MTLPTSPTNNMGAWYETSAPVNETPAPAPGSQQSVPNSPQGSSETANDFTGGFNYLNTISSTQQELANVLEVQSPQSGVPALTNSTQQTIQGCPSVQISNWYSGSVGVVGNKFS
jgi:hypothetical protein